MSRGAVLDARWVTRDGVRELELERQLIDGSTAWRIVPEHPLESMPAVAEGGQAPAAALSELRKLWVANEREACAVKCDEMKRAAVLRAEPWSVAFHEVAAAIRARGES